MEFFMAMIPPTATHQEKQVRVVKGKPVFYDPPEVKAARAKLTAHLAGFRPDEPMRGAIMLGVKWCFPRGEHQNGEYRITKPDTDNLQKLLKDCMTTAGFWKDDAQVAREFVEKFWAENPGIYVFLEEIATGDRGKANSYCKICGNPVTVGLVMHSECLEQLVTDVSEKFCDSYCRWPLTNAELLETHCDSCPIDELLRLTKRGGERAEVRWR